VELTGFDPAEARADGETGPVDVAAMSDAPVLLDAGQSITLASTVTTARVVEQSQREQQRALSWQEGIHDFSATPLEDVIREINRYSPLEIEIADPALRELQFGGIFRIGDTQPLLDALETSYGVNVQRLGTTKVRLSLVADANRAPPRNTDQR
jgi:transmembrane sensor